MITAVKKIWTVWIKALRFLSWYWADYEIEVNDDISVLIVELLWATGLYTLHLQYFAVNNNSNDTNININHKNYNFLDCDWFKKVLFSTNSLAKLLSNSSISQSHLNFLFKSTKTFKVVVTCVRACVRARASACFVFWRLIAGRRGGGLRMFTPPLSVF